MNIGLLALIEAPPDYGSDCVACSLLYMFS